MSLTTKSYEMTSGFTAMTADELFFINGGSGSKSSGITKQDVGYIVSRVIAEIVFIGSDDAVLKNN